MKMGGMEMRKQKLLKQRLTGLLMLGLCVVVIMLAANGTSYIEKDVSALFILFPAAVYMLLGGEMG